MWKSILGSTAITFLGALFAANIHFVSSGDYADQFIASLLLYLLFVVSVLGIQILRKLNGRLCPTLPAAGQSTRGSKQPLGLSEGLC